MTRISANPLYAIRLGHDLYRREQEQRRLSRQLAKQQPSAPVRLWRYVTGRGGKGKTEPMETVILEKTIVKLLPGALACS